MKNWNSCPRTTTLTGLPNRRHFDEFSTRLWRRATRHEEPVGILMRDIDYFKRYNDHYGHPAGALPGENGRTHNAARPHSPAKTS